MTDNPNLTVTVEFRITEEESRRLDELVDFFRAHGAPDTTREGVCRAVLVDSFVAFDEVRNETKTT